MYLAALPLRTAPRQLDLPSGPDPLASARLALARIRKLLAGFVAGMRWDAFRLRAALARPLPVPALERERLFALGWLAWLEGGDAAPLAEAEALCLAAGADTAGMGELPALEPNLLLARCAYWLARVRLRLGEEAVAPYEAVLRKLGGSPQATAWFVDLLWRAGRTDRAEQVWKSVRTNKRVLGTDEGPLLDARLHLRRGEMGPAEKALREAAPKSGPVWVEWHLLLAWAQANPRRAAAAEEELDLAATGPYRASAIEEWRAAVRDRAAGRAVTLDHLPPGWRDFVEAPREAGALRAVTRPAVAPLVRYALCVLGEDSAAEVLTLPLPVSLAQRLRARLAAERFLRREVGHAETLEALTLAERGGFLTPLMAHARRLCQALAARGVTRDGLAAIIEGEADGPARRNAVAVAEEIAERRLSPEEQEALLPLLGDAVRLRVRLALTTGRAELLGDLDTADARLAREALGEGWPAELPPRCGPLAQALALHELAAKGDIASVVANLEDLDAWRGLRAAPGFVLSALTAIAPGQPALHKPLAAWAALWPGTALPGEDAAPPGVAPEAWFLHQAARSLSRGDALAAWRHLTKVSDPPPEAAELRARAEAEGIARAMPPGGPRGERLADLVTLLRETPGGAAILESALAGDADAVRRGLAALAQWGEASGPLPPLGELPARLHHHLAVLAWREAQADEAAMTRAWRHWLAVLPTLDDDSRRVLLDHLFAWHRERIGGHLARGQLEPARRHWDAVRSLAARGGGGGLAEGPPSEGTNEELARRAEAFRDELATEYLVQTREAMKHGDIPRGWRSDYERGLTSLRRMLSLDRDNVRLLTAIVAICVEWFIDFYHTEDWSGMREQASRHLPLANHLGRLVADRDGELSARAALAEFTKFRGLMDPSPATKAALYREGLKWDPANENLKDLLRELGHGEDEGGAEDEGREEAGDD